MTVISDEYMKQMLNKTKNYSMVILKPGPRIKEPGVEKIIWEHGRRNFALRDNGVLSIVCPVKNGSDINGFGIFNAGVDEVKEIMNEDPGVKAGVFNYEVYLCRSFPGESLL